MAARTSNNKNNKGNSRKTTGNKNTTKKKVTGVQRGSSVQDTPSADPRGVIGIILFCAGILLLACQFIPNSGGFLNLCRRLMYGLGGRLCLLLPLMLCWAGVTLVFFKEASVNIKRLLCGVAIFFFVEAIFEAFRITNVRNIMTADGQIANYGAYLRYSYNTAANSPQGGGLLGALLGWPLYLALDVWGTMIVLIFAIIIMLVIMTGTTFMDFGPALSNWADDLRENMAIRKEERAALREQREEEKLEAEAERALQRKQRNDSEEKPKASSGKGKTEEAPESPEEEAIPQPVKTAGAKKSQKSTANRNGKSKKKPVKAIESSEELDEEIPISETFKPIQSRKLAASTQSFEDAPVTMRVLPKASDRVLYIERDDEFDRKPIEDRDEGTAAGRRFTDQEAEDAFLYGIDYKAQADKASPRETPYNNEPIPLYPDAEPWVEDVSETTETNAGTEPQETADASWQQPEPDHSAYMRPQAAQEEAKPSETGAAASMAGTFGMGTFAAFEAEKQQSREAAAPVAAVPPQMNPVPQQAPAGFAPAPEPETVPEEQDEQPESIQTVQPGPDADDPAAYVAPAVPQTEPEPVQAPAFPETEESSESGDRRRRRRPVQPVSVSTVAPAEIDLTAERVHPDGVLPSSIPPRGIVSASAPVQSAAAQTAQPQSAQSRPVQSVAPQMQQVQQPQQAQSQQNQQVIVQLRENRADGTPLVVPQKDRHDEMVEKPKAYEKPPLDLLRVSRKSEDPDQQAKDAEGMRKLLGTLESFGVQAKGLNYTHGPAITRYEIQPAPGVKVSRIVNLVDDIALNMASTGVRIEAPIPGKAAVGIEVPNESISMVTLRDVLDTPEMNKESSPTAVALGKGISGKPVIADMAKMPHVLIAGATGAGKSVCINTIINSIIFRASPDEVRLILVDPKVVELSVYNGIPHLLIPVVTDPKKASAALDWAVVEMEHRYKRFEAMNVRDIKGYNEKIGPDEPKMYKIIVIIDELADLMMVAPGEVEESICRLAQLARAAGIHLVIATQRPSVNVITGVIKANIPSRIAFAVSSQIDSRTILDSGGAEKLLGKGDMLYAPQGAGKPTRVQGCFVSDQEVEDIVTFVKGNHTAEYSEDIIERINTTAEPEKPAEQADSGGGQDSQVDELLNKAIDLAVESGQVSISMLQRRLRVGYARAGRLVDEMTLRGITGEAEGPTKPRQVLISREEWRRMQEEDSAGTA